MVQNETSPLPTTAFCLSWMTIFKQYVICPIIMGLLVVHIFIKYLFWFIFSINFLFFLYYCLFFNAFCGNSSVDVFYNHFSFTHWVKEKKTYFTNVIKLRWPIKTLASEMMLGSFYFVINGFFPNLVEIIGDFYSYMCYTERKIFLLGRRYIWMNLLNF